MTTDRILLAVYGVLLIVGGFIGAKAGSKVSLIMGAASGIIVLVGVYLANSSRLGYGIVLSMSAILAIMFLMRLIKTHKFMPSGMLMILSIAALAVAISRFMQK